MISLQKNLGSHRTNQHFLFQLTWNKGSANAKDRLWWNRGTSWAHRNGVTASAPRWQKLNPYPQGIEKAT